MARPSIDCERAHLWASLAADAEITELERSALRAHLRSCPSCAAYADQVEALVDALRRTPPLAPPRALFAPGPPRARRRLQLAVSAAAVAAALALGSLAGTLSSGSAGRSPQADAASHRLLIQQSLLALMAGSADRRGGGGRTVPS